MGYRKRLRASIEVTSKYREYMPAEHARSLFKLSEALLQIHGKDEEAQHLRHQAGVYLERKTADVTGFETEACYDVFIPIFWR